MGAAKLLLDYDYPGNVRELNNLIERLVILTRTDAIGERDARALLPVRAADWRDIAYDEGKTLREMLEDVERAIIRRALDHHLGNVTATADALRLERSHPYKKMRAPALSGAAATSATTHRNSSHVGAIGAVRRPHASPAPGCSSPWRPRAGKVAPRSGRCRKCRRSAASSTIRLRHGTARQVAERA